MEAARFGWHRVQATWIQTPSFSSSAYFGRGEKENRFDAETPNKQDEDPNKTTKTNAIPEIQTCLQHARMSVWEGAQAFRPPQNSPFSRHIIDHCPSVNHWHNTRKMLSHSTRSSTPEIFKALTCHLQSSSPSELNGFPMISSTRAQGWKRARNKYMSASLPPGAHLFQTLRRKIYRTKFAHRLEMTTARPCMPHISFMTIGI